MEDTSDRSKPLRVLMLEDMPTDAELVLRELRNVGIEFVSRRVATRAEFQRALDEFRPDLVLSDFSLSGGFDGMAALEMARATLPDVPYIFVSGTIGEDRAVEVLRRGATDYVLKDRLDRLVPVVRRALIETRERAARRAAETAVRAQRTFLRQVIDLDHNFIFAKDRDGRFTLANRALAEAYGTTVSELVGKSELDFGASREAFEQGRRMDREVMDSLRERFVAEERLTDAQGRVRWVQTVKCPIVGSDGHAALVLGIATDITERKRHEERIERLSRVHVMLSGINSMILRLADRDELFREACRIAVAHGGFALAWIGVIEPATGAIKPVAHAGTMSEFVGRLKYSVREDVPEGRGATGLAVRERRPVFSNDLAADPRVRQPQLHQQQGFRALAVLPLLVGGEPHGVLRLYSTERNIFDDEETRVLNELAANISFALEHMATAERLDFLAYYDPVTGLANRKLFHERVTQLIAAARAKETKFQVVMVNLQRFRQVNETLGIAAGDELLRAVGQRLVSTVTNADIVARIGADHFALALAVDDDDTDHLRRLDIRLHEALDASFTIAGEALRIPAQLGVAVCPTDGQDAEDLMVNAEAALQTARESGDRLAFYAPQMNERVAAQLRLENELHLAIRDEQFLLHYQPRVEFDSGRVCGLEALLRWKHPVRGMVQPGEFVPVLEQTGMIFEVGTWALRRAAADRNAWIARGLNPPRIAVNVSQAQLRRGDFVDTVIRALGGTAGASVDIEITESMLLENVEDAIAKLVQLRNAGISVALDDFGIGYSSLGYLARLPVDSLKIDRSFVSQMLTSAESRVIVSSVIVLAHALTKVVVAEGVETDEQAALLRELRCDEAQGYFYYRPMPAADIEALLADAQGVA